MQAWDLNGPAPAEIGKGYDLVMACNTLHTGADIAGEAPPFIAGRAATLAPIITMHSCALTGVAILSCSHAGPSNELPCCALSGIVCLAAMLAHAADFWALKIILPCCTLTSLPCLEGGMLSLQPHWRMRRTSWRPAASCASTRPQERCQRCCGGSRRRRGAPRTSATSACGALWSAGRRCWRPPALTRCSSLAELIIDWVQITASVPGRLTSLRHHPAMNLVHIAKEQVESRKS